MKNLSRSGRKTVLEGGNDIRIQPIKTRLEEEELLSKLERNHQFTREMGQQWNDWVKDVFSDIDERTQINDATFHETMATAQAFGINKDDSFYLTVYVALIHKKFSFYPNEVKLANEFMLEREDGDILVQTLGQALTLGSKQLTHLRVFRDQWFTEPIDINVDPKEAEDLINLIMMNNNWADLRKMVPKRIQDQFQRNGKYEMNGMPSRMVSILSEQACAIVSPMLRADRIVAHIATFARFQVNSDDRTSERFLPAFIKQQLIAAVKMVIPDNEDGSSSEEKLTLMDKQSFDVVQGITKERFPYLECERTSQVKAFYLVAQDETIVSELLDIMETCDMFGRTLYFKMDLATLTRAIVKLFDMLLTQKWTGNTAAIKTQLGLLTEWVQYADGTNKYYLDENADESAEFNASCPKVLIPGMPTDAKPGAKRQLGAELTETKRNKTAEDTTMRDNSDDEGDDQEQQLPEELRKWTIFAAEVAFIVLDEVQIGHLVRLKGEPYIDSAVVWTMKQKLQKLKQMAEFFFGESDNQLGEAFRNNNFVNDEMVNRAEKMEFKPTFCINNDPKMLAQWLNQAGGQTSTLEEVQTREREYVTKGRALEVKARQYDKPTTPEDLKYTFSQLSRFMSSIPRKITNSAIRGMNAKLKAADIIERDDMATVLKKLGVQEYYYKGGGPATAFAWVFIFEEEKKKERTATFKALIPYLNSFMQVRVPQDSGKGNNKSKGKGKGGAWTPGTSPQGYMRAKSSTSPHDNGKGGYGNGAGYSFQTPKVHERNTHTKRLLTQHNEGNPNLDYNHTPMKTQRIICVRRDPHQLLSHITEMRTRDKGNSGTERWRHEGGDSIVVSIMETTLRNGIVATARRPTIIQRRRKRTKSSSRKIASANEGGNSIRNNIVLLESTRNTTDATRHQGCVVHESKLQIKKHKKENTNISCKLNADDRAEQKNKQYCNNTNQITNARANNTTTCKKKISNKRHQQTPTERKQNKKQTENATKKKEKETIKTKTKTKKEAPERSTGTSTHPIPPTHHTDPPIHHTEPPYSPTRSPLSTSTCISTKLTNNPWKTLYYHSHKKKDNPTATNHHHTSHNTCANDPPLPTYHAWKTLLSLSQTTRGKHYYHSHKKKDSTKATSTNHYTSHSTGVNEQPSHTFPLHLCTGMPLYTGMLL